MADRRGRPRWLSGPARRPEPGAAPTEPAEERVSLASNWTLVWWRFRKHRLAMASAVVLLGLYAVVLCPDFFSTQDPSRPRPGWPSSRSSGRALLDGFRWSPWVPGRRREAQPDDAPHGVAGRPEPEGAASGFFVARLSRTACSA